VFAVYLPCGAEDHSGEAEVPADLVGGSVAADGSVAGGDVFVGVDAAGVFFNVGVVAAVVVVDVVVVDGHGLVFVVEVVDFVGEGEGTGRGVLGGGGDGSSGFEVVLSFLEDVLLAGAVVAEYFGLAGAFDGVAESSGGFVAEAGPSAAVQLVLVGGDGDGGRVASARSRFL